MSCWRSFWMAARSAALPPVTLSADAAGPWNHFPCHRRCERRAPHPAETFPAAVPQLLQDHQPRATNLLHLTTRRLNIRTSDVAPLDRPAFEYRQVLGFWNVTQHLDPRESGPAFVALSNSFFANLRRTLRRTASSVNKSVRATGSRDRVAAISRWWNFSMPAKSA